MRESWKARGVASGEPLSCLGPQKYKHGHRQALFMNTGLRCVEIESETGW